MKRQCAYKVALSVVHLRTVVATGTVGFGLWKGLIE